MTRLGGQWTERPFAAPAAGPTLVSGALGLSTHPEPREAMRDALAQARGGLAGEAVFAVVAATADLFADLDGFETGLATLDELPHIGTSTHSLTAAGSTYESRALAVLLVGGAVRAKPFALTIPGRALDRPSLPDLFDALEELGGPAASVVAFADPRGPQVPMIPRLVEKLAPGATLVGGGSTAKGVEIFQICNGQVRTGICVGLAVGAPATPVGTFVTQGGELVGQRGLVTKCEGGTLFEVDGQPATELLESLKKASLPVKVEDIAGLLSLAVAPGGLQALERGQFLVRNLSGVDSERKALTAAARLEKGWAVSLLLREGIGSRSQVAGNARRLAGALGARPPAAGLYFDCMSRGQALYGADGVDETQIRKAMGTFPLLSLKSSFELGPLVIGERARPELHLYSGVLWVLAGEGPDASVAQA